MKKLILFIPLLLPSCGYQQLQSEVVGQPKNVIHQNPILCDRRIDLDLSLGVMRNGIGSMSTKDEYFTVANQADVDLLTKAVESGALVKIHYDLKRWTWCWHEKIITKVELVQ